MKKLLVVLMFLFVLPAYLLADTAFLRPDTLFGWIYETPEATPITTATGAIVVIPAVKDKGPITVTMVAGASVGTIYTTTSYDYKVAADMDQGVRTNAVWEEWANGDTSGTLSDVIVGTVTGIYGSLSSGTSVRIIINY